MPDINVKIPSMLTRISQGKNSVTVSGVTVREAIADLERQFPGFQAKLYTSEGELHSYVNIYLGRQNTRFMEGLETKIGEENEIKILPAIAGG